jgi:hypothetical protein
LSRIIRIFLSDKLADDFPRVSSVFYHLLKQAQGDGIRMQLLKTTKKPRGVRKTPRATQITPQKITVRAIATVTPTITPGTMALRVQPTILKLSHFASDKSVT